MTPGAPPPVVFLAPGRYPDHKGTPLAIRWLAEAWAERGHAGQVWTADRTHRPLPPIPGRPFVPHRALGPFALDSRSGPSVRRLLGALSLLPPLHRLPSQVHVHAHGPDAAWLCCLLRRRSWLAHRHTDMAQEMPSYWPRMLALSNMIGHALDLAITKAPITMSFSSTAGERTIDPVVPRYEISHVSKKRRQPSGNPTVAYLGNADGYQELESLFSSRWSLGVRRRWVFRRPPPAALAARAAAAGFELVHAGSLEALLDATSSAWWGLCPRRLDAGYPYKLLTYAMLGVPALCSRAWRGPAPVRVVEDWRAPLPVGSSPPPRATLAPIHQARERALDRLEHAHRTLSRLPLHAG